MSAAVQATQEHDRSRYPFLSPSEREALQDELRLDQASDAFEPGAAAVVADRAPVERAPVVRSVSRPAPSDAAAASPDGRFVGFLGVPQRERERPRRRAVGTETVPPVRVEPEFAAAPRAPQGEAPAPPAAPADRMPEIGDAVPSAISDRAAKFLDVPLAEVSAAGTEIPAPVTSMPPADGEEMRRIRGWLTAEVDRIEGVLVAHLARQAGAGVGPAEPARPKAPSSRPAASHGPVDLDEAHRAARAEARDPFAPRRAVPDDGSMRPSGLRLTRPPASDDAGPGEEDDDIPAFLRECAPDRPAAAPRWREQRAARTQPMPPLVSPSVSLRPAGMPAAPYGSQSTWSALFLAYAAFALIPAVEWLSWSVDPRIGAVAPALAFMVWLAIHAVRRDQLVQIRVLTAWQIGHVALGMHAIRPWGGTATLLYWTTASVAVACAVLVAAASAAVETYEYRRSRRQVVPPRPAPRRVDPFRAQTH